MTKYQIELENSEKAFDVAIAVYGNHPPIGWLLLEVEWIIHCRKETKVGLVDRKLPISN